MPATIKHGCLIELNDDYSKHLLLGDYSDSLGYRFRAWIFDWLSEEWQEIDNDHFDNAVPRNKLQ